MNARARALCRMLLDGIAERMACDLDTLKNFGVAALVERATEEVFGEGRASAFPKRQGQPQGTWEADSEKFTPVVDVNPKLRR